MKLIATRVPCDADFWKTPPFQFNAQQASALASVKGFASALPYAWTKGENNDMKLNDTLITEANPEGSGGAVEKSGSVLVAVEPEVGSRSAS